MVLNCPEASVQPAPMTGDPESLATKAVTSGVWVVALNLINRGFGILRTVILARLLTPDDFGLLGLALLTTATLETLSQTGFHGAIIQRQKNIDSYLNTAWTCSALRGMILFALLYFLSPQVADFFDDTRVVPIIRVIAISILLSGFANIGIVLFKKELRLQKAIHIRNPQQFCRHCYLDCAGSLAEDCLGTGDRGGGGAYHAVDSVVWVASLAAGPVVRRGEVPGDVHIRQMDACSRDTSFRDNEGG